MSEYIDIPERGHLRRVRADSHEAIAHLASLPRPPVQRGPGTELKAMLAGLGIAEQPNCPCKARAAQMDAWGAAGCRAHRDEIISWMRDGQTAWGWLDRLKAAARAVTSGLAFAVNWLDPWPGLIDEAIRRAEKLSILITGGIGDVFALEATMTADEREHLETIYLACPAQREIAHLFQALPNYPRLKNYVVMPTGRQVYYDIAAVVRDHGPLPGVDDWSINARFPLRRPYLGSSFLTHRLTTAPTIERRYVVVVPASRGFGQWTGRDFDDTDWAECLDYLDREGVAGVVLGKERSVPLPSPALIDLRGKTSISESVELLKSAAGYIGIDSCLSVLAAKLFPEQLSVKSVWDHCYANRATYYAPRVEFGFLNRAVVTPRNTQAGRLVVTTCQGIGDAFWAYQKLATHYDELAFRIAQIDGGAGKAEGRAREWLLMLPKVASVGFRRMSHAAYTALAHATVPLPLDVGEAEYCVNAPLEAGVRIEDIDPAREIVETVELPDEPVDGLPDDFVCLYISGDTCRDNARQHSGCWTAAQWIEFLRLTGERRIVMIGASYDRVAVDAIAQHFDVDARIDLPPAQVLNVLRRCRYFVGYQSGLSVMADQVDARQLMLYFPVLEKMLYSWCKPSNVRTRFRADVFRDPQEVFNDLRGIGFFDPIPVDAGQRAVADHP